MNRLQCQKHGWWSLLLWLVLLAGLPSQSLGVFSNANGDNLRAGVPKAERARLDFLYDDAGRRVMKAVSVWNGSTFANPATNWFAYDGWNLAGELSVTAEGCVELVRSYTWGLDLSGSLDGAGGIGGVVVVTDYATGTSYFPAYDGNGNILALVNAADGSVAAQYEYSPFGELIRSTGTMAKANPFHWSTKYWDEETGLVYYGYRYYSPTLGRWLGRDTKGEEAALNLFLFCHNNPLIRFDTDGRSDYISTTLTMGLVGGLSSSFSGYLTGGWEGAAGGFVGGFLGGCIENPILGGIVGGGMSSLIGNKLNGNFDAHMGASFISAGFSAILGGIGGAGVGALNSKIDKTALDQATATFMNIMASGGLGFLSGAAGGASDNLTAGLAEFMDLWGYGPNDQ